MFDAVRYLVDNGVKWMALPVDFPYFLWNQICQLPTGLPCLTWTIGNRVAVAGTPI